MEDMHMKIILKIKKKINFKHFSFLMFCFYFVYSSLYSVYSYPSSFLPHYLPILHSFTCSLIHSSSNLLSRVVIKPFKYYPHLLKSLFFFFCFFVQHIMKSKRNKTRTIKKWANVFLCTIQGYAVAQVWSGCIMSMESDGLAYLWFCNNKMRNVKSNSFKIENFHEFSLKYYNKNMRW